SVTLSGAATGTVAAGLARTFKMDGTSLTVTVNGSPTFVHVREALGIRVEEQRTNLTTNSGARDGTVGVVGSGGVLPTGWSIPASLGLDVEVLATNVDPSIGGCRIRISGTTTDAGNFRLQCSSATSRESTDPGVISSIFCRAVDGSTTNMTGGVVNITQVNASGGSPGNFDPFDGHTSLNAARREATSSGTTTS